MINAMTTDCILMSLDSKAIDDAIRKLHASKQNFMIKEVGEVGDFLGVT